MKILILFSIILSLNFPKETFSQPGNPDPSFGNNGIVTTKIGTADAPAKLHWAVKQDDDKILAVGEYYNGFDQDFLIVRYNPDGDLDTTFGNDGIVITQVESFDDVALTAAIQNDEKIIAGGTSFNRENVDILITRYNSDGSIDNSFGTEGIVITNPGDSVVGSGFTISSLALQNDGKIIAAGSLLHNEMDYIVVRYNPDGTIDNSFGENGIVISRMENQTDYFNSVTLQSDGKIVAAGYSQSDASIIVRFNSGGTLDSTFGINGTLTPGESDDHANAVVIQGDQKILAAGDSRNISGNKDFTLIRINPDGILDSTFGINGIVKTDAGSYDFARSVSIQSDEKIVVTGESGDMEFIHFVLARYNKDGSIDSSFGGNGIVKTVIDQESVFPHSVMVQNNQKIIVAGESTTFTLARYNQDGVLDDSFSGNGIVKTFFYSSKSAACAALLQNDQKIIAAGFTTLDIGQAAALARYNSNGTLDNTFGSNGITINENSSGINSLAIQDGGKIISGIGYNYKVIRYNSDGSTDNTFISDSIEGESSSLTLQSDGKIIVGGMSSGNFTAVRYNNDGSFDNSFGTNGIASVPVPYRSHVYSTAVQFDEGEDKIILAGQFFNGSNYDFVMVRFNSQGIMDSTFGINGIVITQVGSFDDWIISIKIQNDGKIVAAGETWNGENQDLAVVRYLENGIIDSTFGTYGIVSTSMLPSDEYCRASVIQEDGKIITGGNTIVNGYLNTGVFLIRYNSDGSPDNTFGTNGIVSTMTGSNNDQVNSLIIQPDGKLIAAGGLSEFTLLRYLNDSVIPVELNSFLISVSYNQVLLSWSVSSETNNRKFDIEKRRIKGTEEEPWERIGSVIAQGTGINNEYTYKDDNTETGTYKYRLKQIDFDGSYKYYFYDESIVIAAPESFELFQNYPNPFNPETTIKYRLPGERIVILKIYNVLGNEVALLVNEKKEAGEYKIQFDGSNLSSGVFFYKITAEEFTETKKMIMLR